MAIKLMTDIIVDNDMSDVEAGALLIMAVEVYTQYRKNEGHITELPLKKVHERISELVEDPSTFVLSYIEDVVEAWGLGAIVKCGDGWYIEYKEDK